MASHYSYNLYEWFWQENIKGPVGIAVSLFFGSSQYDSSLIPLDSIKLNPIRISWAPNGSLAEFNMVGVQKSIKCD